jgi:hypothetical protein
MTKFLINKDGPRAPTAIPGTLGLKFHPTPWKEAKAIALSNPGEDPTFSKNLRPIGLLSTTRKLFEKVVLKIVQRHIGSRNL